LTHSVRASIVITSYNYARFLQGSIDSALAQTYPNLEVIVVDDGSTDGSRDIIAGYGDRIVPILKPNGGMGSAFNAGYRASRGDVICFLDADDTLLPETMERAVPLFRPNVAKVHWPLWVVDEQGRRTGSTYPEQPLSEGDLHQRVLRYGDEGYVWPVTSGNAWSRDILSRLFPIPEPDYRESAESYLATLAPAFGTVSAIREPLGTYRLHAQSLSHRSTVHDVMRVTSRRHELIQEILRRAGFDVDRRLWSPNAATRQRISEICAELEGILPSASRFLFVEWNQWGPRRVLARCHAVPFLERDGQYWGRPPDDATAIEELERLRSDGAMFIVFAWPALWWLEYYSGLAAHLRSRYVNVRENENVSVFDLRQDAWATIAADLSQASLCK